MTNSKFHITGVLVLIVLTVIFVQLALAQGQASKSIEVGRYQLFQGTYIVLDGKNSRAERESAVFLLDTATGTVRKYGTGLLKDGTLFETWDSTQRK